MRKLPILLMLFVALMLIGSAKAEVHTCNSCATCQAEVNAAAAGDTVQLTASFTMDYNSPSPGDCGGGSGKCMNMYENPNIILDMNGKTISYDSSGGDCDYFMNEIPNNVTIMNGTFNAGGNNLLYGSLQASGTYFTVHDVTFTGHSQDICLQSSGTYPNFYRNVFSGCQNGMYVTPTNGVVANNSFLSNSLAGLQFIGGNNVTVTNNVFTSCGDGSATGGAMYLVIVTNSTFRNNTITSSNPAVKFSGAANYNVFNDSNITGSTYGIYLVNTSAVNKPSWNTFYNNFFNNTANYYNTSAGFTNNFNTTKTSGTNIFGGSYRGGNYWANATHTGYSDTCVDMSPGDGICDVPYEVNSYDYLPLTEPFSDTTAPAITIVSPVNVTYSGDVNLNVTVDEAAESCVYHLDGASNVTLSNSSVTNWYTEIVGASETTHQLSVSCGDLYGNWGLNDTVWFTIDNTAPIVTVQSPTNVTYYVNRVNLNVTSSSDTDVCRYNLGGSNTTLSNSSVTNWFAEVTSLTDSTYHLNVWCGDLLGNWRLNNTVWFTVNAVPDVVIVSPANTTYTTTTGAVNLNVAANMNVTTWKYSVNGAANVTFTPNITLNLPSGQKHLVVYADGGMSDVWFTVYIPQAPAQARELMFAVSVFLAIIVSFYAFNGMMKDESVENKIKIVFLLLLVVIVLGMISRATLGW